MGVVNTISGGDNKGNNNTDIYILHALSLGFATRKKNLELSFRDSKTGGEPLSSGPVQPRARVVKDDVTRQGPDG